MKEHININILQALETRKWSAAVSWQANNNKPIVKLTPQIQGSWASLLGDLLLPKII